MTKTTIVTASHLIGCERFLAAAGCSCEAVTAAAAQARAVSIACQAAGDPAGADRAWATFDAASFAGCFTVPLGRCFTREQSGPWLAWLSLRA